MTSKLAEIVAFCAFAIWFVLFGQGCGGDPHVFEVGDGLDRVVLQQAIDELCQASDGQACAALEYEGSDPGSAIVIDRLPEGVSARTYYDRAADGATIRLSTEAIASGNLFSAFRHELGHAMGCRGRELPDGNAMQATRPVGELPVWTQADLDCVLGR